MKRFKFLGVLLVWFLWLIWFWYCWTLTTNFKWQTVTHDWSNVNINFACTNVLTTSSSDVQSSFSITYSFDSFSLSKNAYLYCANYSQYNWGLGSFQSMAISNNFNQTLSYTLLKLLIQDECDIVVYSLIDIMLLHLVIEIIL